MLYTFDDTLFEQKPSAKTAVVYMLIFNYSNYGKRQGWYGSTRQMSEQAFVKDLSKSTVATCISELEKLGLIEKRGKAYFTVQPKDKAVQLQAKAVQLRPKTVQAEDKIVQSEDKTVQPQDNYIYNKDNNKDRERNIDSAHIDSCATNSLSPTYDDLFLRTEAAFNLLPGIRHITDESETKAWKAWQNYTPEQQKSLYEAVKKGYTHPKRNFQFAVEDFLDYSANYSHAPKQIPTPQDKPINYQGQNDPGDTMPAIDPETGAWGLFKISDIEKFDLMTHAKLKAQAS